MGEQGQRTISYLLRLWQTGADGEQVWRASLESARTGQRQGFDSLQTLFDFLQEQTTGKEMVVTANREAQEEPSPSSRREMRRALDTVILFIVYPLDFVLSPQKLSARNRETSSFL